MQSWREKMPYNHKLIKILSCLIFNRDKRHAFRVKYGSYLLNSNYEKAMQICENAKNLVDIGCGPNPHSNAKYAIDRFASQTIHRHAGGGAIIDDKKLKERGIRFVESPVEQIPFEDKFFDVSLSRHMIEHVEDPIVACREIMRVSKSGIIICPNVFAEYLFGRTYHKWFVQKRENTLIFIEKNENEILPLFGNAPKLENGKVKGGKNINPFDILLNDGHWYHGFEGYKRLSRKLRMLWYGHEPAIENVLIWKDSFNVVVIDKSGNVSQI